MAVKKHKKQLVFLVHAAVIGALYAALTLVFGGISFGPIQFRVAEAMTILPYFTPAAIPGLYVGCLIANIYSGNIFDIIFGSLATLIAAIFSYLLRKHAFLTTLPPVITNALIIPFILKYAYHVEDAVWFMMLTIAIGQILACCVLGYPLLLALKKRAKVIFGNSEKTDESP